MQTTDFRPGGLNIVERTLGEDGPVLMVNLLRYHDYARYPNDDLPLCSGREAYHSRYVPAFAMAADGQDIAPEYIATVQASLVGPDDEPWDEVAIVRYPNLAVFRALIESAEYQEKADPHRRAALADWRLIATTALPLPGGVPEDAS